jgi:hypothetical protein
LSLHASYVLSLMMPAVIYNYSIIINVGDFVKPEILAEVYQKHTNRMSRHHSMIDLPKEVSTPNTGNKNSYRF